MSATQCLKAWACTAHTEVNDFEKYIVLYKSAKRERNKGMD